MSRRQVSLPDGRRLDHLELGDRAGVPAIYLHGTPSSASEARWLDAAARRRGVRLLSPDRPGYLRSEAPPDPSFLGVAQDVLDAADALGVERFAIVGFSGGAGFALATAHLAPNRVSIVHIGGGLGPLTGDASNDLPTVRRITFSVAARVPAISRPLLGGVFALLRRGIRKRLDTPAEAARWFFEGPAKGAQVAAVEEYIRSTAPEDLRAELHDYAEATRSTRAVINDVTGYVRPWPFDPRRLTTRVELWHGRDDPAAPVRSAERMASASPNVKPHLFDGEGHFVFHSHGEEVVASIREHAGT